MRHAISALRILLATTGLFIGGEVISAQDPAPPAAAAGDRPLVILGPVITMDPALPRSDGLVVRRGRIEALGGEAAAAAASEPGAEVHALPAGAVALPGVIESHAHLLGLGKEQRQLDLRGAATAEEAAERVRSAAASAPEGRWILGRGWNQELWPDRRFPDRALLDAAAPKNPVLLARVDGHAAWVNTQVLEGAGIAGASSDPPGGEILKDPSGRPTGVLVDNAMDLVSRLVPDGDPAQVAEDALTAQRLALAAGITTFVDAGISSGALQSINPLYADGRMKLRLYAMAAVDDAKSLEAVVAHPPIRSLYDDRVAVRALKLYADRALGSRGARLLEPYADRPGATGLAVLEPSFIEAAARRALAAGYQVCVHAIGDRAVRDTLDAFERALAAAEPAAKANHRFRIEHAQLVDPADVPRFLALGVLPSMQACHATSDGPWVPARLGPSRTARISYPWRSLLDAGCVIPNGTDAPVEPISPWANLFAAATRFLRTPDGAFEAFVPAQRMNRYEALASLTAWGALGTFSEHRRGRIRPGYDADVVLVDRDPLACPVFDLPATRVLATIVAGDVVYRSAP